jgi:Sensors of blue-light using FAD
VLVRLVYASRVVEHIDERLINSILEQSRRHNTEHGITGILCTQPAQDVFMQVLEGARAHVNALYTNIVRDPRHKDVTLLLYEEIEERKFPSWRMGSVDLKRINLSTILRYSENAVLDPFTMTGRGALALLSELVETAAIVTARDPEPERS